MCNDFKYCDLTCEHATFPESNALDGACRREISLYCMKYETLVPKNSVCIESKKAKGKNI